MSTNEPDRTLMQAMTRMDALLQRIDQIGDAAVRENVTDIIQGLLDLHGQALARLLALLGQQGDQSGPILEALEADQLISSVLLVHGLHPRSAEQRVQRALQQVQPFLAVHNGRVELLEVTPKHVVRLRLEGDCRTCPSSRLTLTNLIEEAIYMAAPEISAIEVEGVTDSGAAVAASSPTATQPSAQGSRMCGMEPLPSI